MRLGAIQPKFGAVLFVAQIKACKPVFDPTVTRDNPGKVTLRPLKGNDIDVLTHSPAARELSHLHGKPDRTPDEIQAAWRGLHQELSTIHFLKNRLTAAERRLSLTKCYWSVGLFQHVFGNSRPGERAQIQRLMIGGILKRIDEASLGPKLTVASEKPLLIQEGTTNGSAPTQREDIANGTVTVARHTNGPATHKPRKPAPLVLMKRLPGEAKPY